MPDRELIQHAACRPATSVLSSKSAQCTLNRTGAVRNFIITSLFRLNLRVKLRIQAATFHVALCNIIQSLCAYYCGRMIDACLLLQAGLMWFFFSGMEKNLRKTFEESWKVIESWNWACLVRILRHQEVCKFWCHKSLKKVPKFQEFHFPMLLQKQIALKLSPNPLWTSFEHSSSLPND